MSKGYVIITATVLLFVALYVLPPKAQAHSFSTKDCRVYAKAHQLVAGKNPRGSRKRCNTKRVSHARAHYCGRNDLRPYAAIKCVFPVSERGTAWRIAKCESTADASRAISRQRGLGRWAWNSTNHGGLFQLGSTERRDYGQYSAGGPAIAQAKSAARLMSARGTQPWDASRGCWS